MYLLSAHVHRTQRQMEDAHTHTQTRTRILSELNGTEQTKSPSTIIFDSTQHWNYSYFPFIRHSLPRIDDVWIFVCFSSAAVRLFRKRSEYSRTQHFHFLVGYFVSVCVFGGIRFGCIVRSWRDPTNRGTSRKWWQRLEKPLNHLQSQQKWAGSMAGSTTIRPMTVRHEQVHTMGARFVVYNGSDIHGNCIYTMLMIIASEMPRIDWSTGRRHIDVCDVWTGTTYHTQDPAYKIECEINENWNHVMSSRLARFAIQTMPIPHCTRFSSTSPSISQYTTLSIFPFFIFLTLERAIRWWHSMNLHFKCG